MVDENGEHGRLGEDGDVVDGNGDSDDTETDNRPAGRYIYPRSRSRSIRSSLSCARPARFVVFAKSCSHAGSSVVLSVDTSLPSERTPAKYFGGIAEIVEKPDDPPSNRVMTVFDTFTPAIVHACHLVSPLIQSGRTIDAIRLDELAGETDEGADDADEAVVDG